MARMLLLVFLWLSGSAIFGQSYRWQQRVDYRMKVHLDDETHKFSGSQTLFYFNQSPDTLFKVFYHLYFNAFQPGSMMDVRSRNIPDPDARVGDRIFALKDDEIGYLKAVSLLQDGEPVGMTHDGTILEVQLNRAIPPGGIAVFEMNFEGQVPVQIRRSGRDNAEGVAYSMAQWYPKMCEYDEQGWHTNPYIAREFYGVWGNFDVEISLNSKYTVAATGHLQNPEEIGHGYVEDIKHKKKTELKWHFVAKDVHDFMWAADPAYTHTQAETADGTILHFFYKETPRNRDAWAALPTVIVKAWPMITSRYGSYPYGKYSFVQGGDGGMEYPMATLITGERSLGSLIGVSIHELMHSWFQMMLGTNESLYSWMDEGFTTFASTVIMNELRRDGSIPGEYSAMPFVDIFNGYRNLIRSGREEPLSTHADHFETNYAYGTAAYTKGAVFLKQIEYIVGHEVFNKTMLDYYSKWSYRHPNPNDLIRIFEKNADMELDWYREYFVNSTKVIEYKMDEITDRDKGCMVTLSRVGAMPMPIDVQVVYKDGRTTWHTIPLHMMRGEKKMEEGVQFKVEPDWPWTNTTYELLLDQSIDKIKSVKIDPSLRLADFDLSNNMIEPGD